MQVVAPDTFERAIIGCLTQLAPSEAKELAANALPALFHNPRNAYVYGVLRESALKGMPLGAETASAAIKQAGSLEHFGGAENAVEFYINDCEEVAGQISSYGEYVDKLKLTHARKTLTTALDESALKAASADSIEEATSQALAGVMQSVADLSSISVKRGNSIADLREGYMERYRGGDTAIAFPQEQLNTTGGVRPGNIVFLSGYTASKKSWTGLDWLTQWMRDRSAWFYTLEMSKDDCLERLLAMECGLDYTDLLKRDLPSGMVDECLETVSAFPLQIHDGGLTVDRMISDHAAAGDDAPSIVAVDHLHLMDFGDDLRMGMNTGLLRLKNWAVEKQLILVLLAQLKRPDDKKKLPRPTMYMFRESSAIEQIADYAIFVHPEREEVVDNFGFKSEKEKMIMWCEKQRNGIPGDAFEVAFKGYRLR